jgi:succinyl-CoA synthetase alpha subunit
VIGEIGGQLEADAAHWIKADGNTKPVVGFIAGVTHLDVLWGMQVQLLVDLMTQLKLKKS